MLKYNYTKGNRYYNRSNQNYIELRRVVFVSKKDETMSLCDKTEDYEILSEEIIDGFKIAKLRTHSGAIVNCRIPIHTEEERTRLSENICEAMIKFVYPDLDITKVKSMEVQF